MSSNQRPAEDFYKMQCNPTITSVRHEGIKSANPSPVEGIFI